MVKSYMQSRNATHFAHLFLFTIRLSYMPTEGAPRLLARREHSGIGLYYHIHQGPHSNGRTK